MMTKFGIITDVKDFTFGSLVVITRHLKATDNVEVKMLKSTSPKALSEGSYDLYKRDSITEIDWSFVEEFYKSYYNCGDIAHNNDLLKLVEGEYEEGDHAHQLLNNTYKGNQDHPQIRIDLGKSNEEIYGAAWDSRFELGFKTS